MSAVDCKLLEPNLLCGCDKLMLAEELVNTSHPVIP